MRAVVREVADLLELRDCRRGTPVRFADQLDLFGATRTPLCLRAQVGRCLGPCAALCTKSEYSGRVAEAHRFLDGRTDRPLAILDERMRQAAERMQFEYAAELRDRLDRLSAARSELVMLSGVIDSLSFVYAPPAWYGSPRVYLVRRGMVHDELPAPRTAAERAAIVERARELFRTRPRSARVQPTQAAEILLLARWFRLRPAELENVWEEPRPGIREDLVTLRGLA